MKYKERVKALMNEANSRPSDLILDSLGNKYYVVMAPSSAYSRSLYIMERLEGEYMIKASKRNGETLLGSFMINFFYYETKFKEQYRIFN